MTGDGGVRVINILESLQLPIHEDVGKFVVVVIFLTCLYFALDLFGETVGHSGSKDDGNDGFRRIDASILSRFLDDLRQLHAPAYAWNVSKNRQEHTRNATAHRRFKKLCRKFHIQRTYLDNGKGSGSIQVMCQALEGAMQEYDSNLAAASTSSAVPPTSTTTATQLRMFTAFPRIYITHFNCYGRAMDYLRNPAYLQRRTQTLGLMSGIQHHLVDLHLLLRNATQGLEVIPMQFWKSSHAIVHQLLQQHAAETVHGPYLDVAVCYQMLAISLANCKADGPHDFSMQYASLFRSCDDIACEAMQYWDRSLIALQQTWDHTSDDAYVACLRLLRRFQHLPKYIATKPASDMQQLLQTFAASFDPSQQFLPKDGAQAQQQQQQQQQQQRDEQQVGEQLQDLSAMQWFHRIRQRTSPIRQQCVRRTLLQRLFGRRPTPVEELHMRYFAEEWRDLGSQMDRIARIEYFHCNSCRRMDVGIPPHVEA